MDPLLIIAVLLGLLALGTVLGLLHRRAAGRVGARPATTQERIDPAGLVEGGVLGRSATVVQFSTQYCARCPSVHRMLADLARDRDGVAHVEVDLTHRADLVERFHVRQTPTLLVLDAEGIPRSRISGAPTGAVVTDELDRLQETR